MNYRFRSQAFRDFWTPGRVLALVIAVGLLVRIAATLTRQMIQADEVAYARLAENLAAGNGYVDITGGGTIYAPLLPIITAGLGLLLGDFVLSGYAVVVIFGALIPIPVYLLGKDLLNARVGLMAAALMALMPFFIGTSEYLYSEGLYTFFFLSTLVFLWRLLTRPGWWYAPAAGISLGLAYLAQPSAVIYLILMLGLTAAVAWKTGGLRKWPRQATLFLLGFLIFAIPYAVFLHAELGRWTFTGKSMAGGIYSATLDVRREDVAASEKALMSLTGENGEVMVVSLEERGSTPLSFIFGRPQDAAKNFIKQMFVLHEHILAQVFPLWLLPLLGLGLFVQRWSRKQAKAYGFLVLMVLPAGLVLSMYAQARFFMPFVPLLAIMVAVGWERLEQWVAETAESGFKRGRELTLVRWAPGLIAVAVLLPLLLNAGLLVKQREYATQYREAGEWLKQNGGDGARVMNRDFSSAFYAGGTHVMLPYSDYGAMTSYARSKNVDFLIVGRQDLVKFRPWELELLQDDAHHPDWRLFHVVAAGSPRETLIFQLVR